MSSVVTFNQLLRELRDNKATIVRLQSRNETISSIIKAVDSLAGTKLAVAEPVKRQVMARGLKDKVFQLMSDGATRNVEQIAVVIFGHPPDPLETRQISNACGYLARNEGMTRVSRGRYKYVAEKEPDVTTVKSADIGHDTHIKQITA